MQSCRIAQSCLLVVALTFALVSCGGKMASTATNAVPNPTSFTNSNHHSQHHGDQHISKKRHGSRAAIVATMALPARLQPILTHWASPLPVKTALLRSSASRQRFPSPTDISISRTRPSPRRSMRLPMNSICIFQRAQKILPQAIEFECQQILNGYVYNFSWQALYPGNTWRIFDYGLKQWQATGIPLTRFTPGTWHHIFVEYHNDTVAHTVIHDAITVDGVRTPVNITHNAFFSGAANNQFTNAFQLDSNSAATPYSVYVDQMKITYR